MNAQNELKDDDFQFEVEGDEQSEVEAKSKPSVDIEIEDDTPEEDRNRTPLPKEIVERLELDELDQYSDEVKTKLKQLKKVWHDERREKENATRQQNEAVTLAKRLVQENNALKNTLNQGEQTLVNTYKQAAELEMEIAKRAYREAYDSGDSDKVLDAQQKISDATYKLQQVSNYRPRAAVVDNNVNIEQNKPNVPTPDEKTLSWQRKNAWWGKDSEMTASALGLHQKLQFERGVGFVGSDEYWQAIDNTMRRRFPEYFGTPDSDNGTQRAVGRESRSSTVVAPASRSTSPKKIVLKKSQLALAKRLGLTAEQYAREYAKTLEN
jgi:hypothetical protein